MANKVKESERIERAIRGLLKLPQNKRCINCNSLGPQYVCTTFWTFVCTNCSGVHREFSHRVKSVSMAKFSAEEVTNIQAGGNERAREIYFKAWDPERHSIPEASNIHRLRDFIKHVYVDRKFTGERSLENLPKLRLNDKEDIYGSRNIGASPYGSRSSYHEDRYERRYSERSISCRRDNDWSFKYNHEERRSPRDAQENSRYGGYSRSPVKLEVVDDRFREDGFGSRRFLNIESKLKRHLADDQKNEEKPQSPAVLPVTKILGENASTLKVVEVSPGNKDKDTDGSTQNQKAASSSCQCSGKENPAEKKKQNAESLIDFSTDSQPLGAAPAPQTPPISQTNNESNWAVFETSEIEKASPQASKANSIESFISELSGPLVLPAGRMYEAPSSNGAPSTTIRDDKAAFALFPTVPMGQMRASPNNVGVPTVASTSANLPTLSSRGVPPQFFPDGHQLSKMPHIPPSASLSAGHSSNMQSTNPLVAPGTSNNQHWLSSAPNTQGPYSATVASSQASPKPAEETNSGARPISFSSEIKSSQRTELPPDLFASPVSVPTVGWQNVQPCGSGFNMQYYPNEMFPNMASLQRALPGVSANASLLRTLSAGALSPRLMVPQSPSYASAMPTQSPFVAIGPTGGAYIDQAGNSTQPPRPQRVGSSVDDGAFLDSLNTAPSPAGSFMAPGTPNSFSTRGNPFG